MIPPNGGVRIKDGRLDFAGASLGFPPPGIPLCAGVNMERIGFGFGLGPTRFTGTPAWPSRIVLVIDGRLVLASPTADARSSSGARRSATTSRPSSTPTATRGPRWGSARALRCGCPVVGEVPLGPGIRALRVPRLPGARRRHETSASGSRLTGVSLIGVNGRVDGEFNAGERAFQRRRRRRRAASSKSSARASTATSRNQGMAVCAKVNASFTSSTPAARSAGARSSSSRTSTAASGAASASRTCAARTPRRREGPTRSRSERDEPSRRSSRAAEGAPRVRVEGPGALPFESPQGSELGAEPGRATSGSCGRTGEVRGGGPRRSPAGHVHDHAAPRIPAGRARAEAKALPGPSVRGDVSGRGARECCTYGRPPACGPARHVLRRRRERLGQADRTRRRRRPRAPALHPGAGSAAGTGSRPASSSTESRRSGA